MAFINRKTKTSLLNLALGSLIATSLSTGVTEASWSSMRCKADCNQTVYSVKKKISANIPGKNKSKSEDHKSKPQQCAENCDNAKIIDFLMTHLPDLPEHLHKNVLETKRSLQMAKQKDIEEKLKLEMGRKKQNKSTILDLKKQKIVLSEDIKDLSNLLNKLASGSAHDFPPPPTDMPPPLPGTKEHEEPSAHDFPPPPTDMPPPLPGTKKHGESAHDFPPPPTDMPPPLPRKDPSETAGKEPSSLKEAPSNDDLMASIRQKAEEREKRLSQSNPESPEPEAKQQASSNSDDFTASIKQKAEERKKRLSQSSPGLSGTQAKQHVLSEFDKQRLNRRASLEGEDAIKNEIIESLEGAKKSNNAYNIAKYSAELDYIEEKIKANTDDWN